MAIVLKKLEILAGIIVAVMALASAPALANSEFDYNLVPSQGTATGTLVIVLTGSGPYATFTNIKASVVSVTFTLNGQVFNLGNSTAFNDFQFGTGGTALRDLTYTGHAGGTPGFALQTTGSWVFTPLANPTTRSLGSFVFASEHPVAVPEPGTLPLMLSGLGMLFAGWAFRRRSVSAKAS